MDCECNQLVMSKVFDRVFTPPSTDEAKSNSILQKKIESHYWVEERHLDIPCQFNLSLEYAQAELHRINGFKAPRDKLIVMQNTLNLVVGIVLLQNIVLYIGLIKPRL